MLKVHETTTPTGELAGTFLFIDKDGGLSIKSERADGEVLVLPLPDGALDAVMARFGAPLNENEKLIPVASLDLGDGRSLRHVRHLGFYDVIARDYLICPIGERGEELFALATTISGALTHLARANAAARSA